MLSEILDSPLLADAFEEDKVDFGIADEDVFTPAIKLWAMVSQCLFKKAGNRELHMDQYCVLVLMWMFNPGSLSESVSIFDPEPLKQIAVTLATEVPSLRRLSRS